MKAIVEGIYRRGKIELLRPLPDLPEGRVRVVLISQGRPAPATRKLTYGEFPGDTSTLDDFKGAQWHGETEFEPDSQ